MITWIVLRAAGIAAYLMLFASVAWGLVATTSALGKKVSKASAVSVHQFLSTVALVFLGVHLGGLLLDRFVPFKLLDLIVPGHSSFRPWAVAFGTLSMYSMVVVLVSSWMRKRVGTIWWRRLHILAAPAFAMSMVHGVLAGTDTVRSWMWSVYLATGSIVLFLILVRGLTAGVRAARRTHPEPARAARSEAAPAPARKESQADLPARMAEPGPPSTRPRGVRTGHFEPAAVRASVAAGDDPAVVIRLDLHVTIGEDGRARVLALAPAEPSGASSNGGPEGNGQAP